MMKTPTDANDFISERIAIDAFSTGGGNVLAAPPKYDRTLPSKYFIEKYAGGPCSNLEVRKAVSFKVLVKAAIRIQTHFRIWRARKIREEKKQEYERQVYIEKEEIKRKEETRMKEMFYR